MEQDVGSQRGKRRWCADGKVGEISDELLTMALSSSAPCLMAPMELRLRRASDTATAVWNKTHISQPTSTELYAPPTQAELALSTSAAASRERTQTLVCVAEAVQLTIRC